MKKQEYTIGQQITLEGINHLKNQLYREAYNAYTSEKDHRWWMKRKREILRGTQFTIISIQK